ncbi:MAG: hypothetical protein JWR39_1790, partial [Devosia sp.]|nr:hypothetical protein [Devosia sp.]
MDGYPESPDFFTGMNEIRDHDGLHASGVRGPNPRMAVFQSQAMPRLDTEATGSQQVWLGMRLGIDDVIASDDGVEQIEQPGGAEM